MNERILGIGNAYHSLLLSVVWHLIETCGKRSSLGSENQQNERKKNNSLIPPSFQTKLLIEIKNATRQKKSVENSQILIFSEENCSRLRKTLERIGSSLIIFQIRNTSLIRNKTVESVLCSSICCEWATEPRLKIINSIREQLSLSINIRTEIYPGPPKKRIKSNLESYYSSSFHRVYDYATVQSVGPAGSPLLHSFQPATSTSNWKRFRGRGSDRQV